MRRGFRQRCQTKERNSDSFPPASPSVPLYHDHRLGFAPRFYRPSNQSRYFCQLYHQLSPGVLVTRKQPGDITRACLRKLYSLWFGISTDAGKDSRSEIRYRSRVSSLANDFNFEKKPLLVVAIHIA